MNELQRIQDNLRNGGYVNNPHGAADDRSILAGEYSYNSGLWEQILMRKPAIWNELRKDTKSDTAAERVYQATSDGLMEQTLKLRLKSIEKMMTALGTIVRLAETDARNQT